MNERETDYKAALEDVRTHLRHRMYTILNDLQNDIDQHDHRSLAINIARLSDLAKIAEVAGDG